MECVPNFSEGRDLQKIDEIVSPFRAKAGVKLLDYSKTGKYFIYNHNRYLIPKNRFRIHDDLRHMQL